MTDLDRHLQAVGQFLEGHLPKSAPAAVAATPIGCDQYLGRTWVTLPPHLLPPAVNRFRGELSGIVVNPHTDPTPIARYIINPVWDSFAQSVVHEVVNSHVVWLTPWHPFTAAVLEIPDQFLLLGVDRDRWLTAHLGLLNHRVHVLELSIAVRMRVVLLGLSVSLRAVSRLTEQPSDRGATDPVALRRQFPGKRTSALEGSSQRRFWITPSGGINQLLQFIQQPGIGVHLTLATAAEPANALRSGTTRQPSSRPELCRAPTNRGRRHACRFRHSLYSAPSIRQRFGGRPPPTHALVHERREVAKPTSNPFNGGCILHSRHNPESRKSLNLLLSTP
jgi:hypothetical protein